MEINSNWPITGYVIQYARVESLDNMIVNVPDNTLSISGLFASAEYSVTVAAVNAKGTGPFSKPVIAISGEDGELNLLHKYPSILQMRIAAGLGSFTILQHFIL